MDLRRGENGQTKLGLHPGSVVSYAAFIVVDVVTKEARSCMQIISLWSGEQSW